MGGEAPRSAALVTVLAAALTVGGNAISVMLTGMGKDGAGTLLEMREAGAATLGAG